MKRRSSYDILHSIAGPDSSLPLPKRDGLEENGIREGIPMTFGISPASPTFKRASSPTRTLSRMLAARFLIPSSYHPSSHQVSQLHP
jgi:hypothetical protein